MKIPELSRSIKLFETFGIQDVKSVYQDASTLLLVTTADFVADTVLKRVISPNLMYQIKLI